MTPEPRTAKVHPMTFPVVIENPAQLEAVGPDTFIDADAASSASADRAASWPWPRRRPADA
jgi:hypothetical protein